MQFRRKNGILTTASMILILCHTPGFSSGLNDELPPFPKITSGIPHDVDGYQIARLCGNNSRCTDNSPNIRIVDRLFDIFSWQSFLAINWPIDEKSGTANPSITGLGHLRWKTWKGFQEVFLPDGRRPAPWQSPRMPPPGFLPLPEAALDEGNDYPRFLNSVTATKITDWDKINLTYVHQAKSHGVLFDQNEHPVYYETLMNKIIFDSIIDNQFYHQKGQIDYLCKKGFEISFPFGQQQSGSPGEGQVGVIMLKLAWKVLEQCSKPGDSDTCQKDDPARFIKVSAFLRTGRKTGEPSYRQEVGLVGMHIAHKTETSAPWIWSTFQHIDNAPGLEEVVLGVPAGQKFLFFDPKRPMNNFNDMSGAKPTQVVRMLPIRPDTAELNEQVRKLLEEQHSVLQHYELIGTQRSIEPRQCDRGPRPALLTNPVIETYTQKMACMTCHSYARAFVTGPECNLEADCTKFAEKSVPPMATGAADFSWMLKGAQRQPE